MLSASLVWRKKHGVDKILSEYELPEVVKKYFPGGWHLNDREERPLLILRLGQMDVKGIIKVGFQDPDKRVSFRATLAATLPRCLALDPIL